MKLEGQGPGLFNVGGGTIELTEDAVVIQKKNTDMSGAGGLLGVALSVATSSKGGYTMPYDAIHSVSISEGGWTAPPFIQILTPGERSVSSSDEAMKSPSCLLFKKGVMAEFKALKTEIEARAAKARRRPDSVAAAPASSLADELRKLGELVTAGILTQDEFNQKKAQLLAL